MVKLTLGSEVLCPYRVQFGLGPNGKMREFFKVQMMERVISISMASKCNNQPLLNTAKKKSLQSLVFILVDH